MKKKVFGLILFLMFQSMSALAQSDVISEVFEAVAQDYVNQISNKEIALKGLKTLSETDGLILIEDDEQVLYLKKNGKTIKQFEMPEEKAALNVWADFCKKVIAQAAEQSTKIEVHDFEMPDRFANAVLNGLDGHSRYFSVFSEDGQEQKLKIKRPFASRVIDNILLMRIVTFKKDISEKVKTAVFECSQCKGIILDLRGNRGGFLNEAIKIADLFLDEGIITYTLSDENGAPQYYLANKGDMTASKPMVILVDGLTASAAEVLAGALFEQNRAVLIGTKTYGKGSVQDVKKMDKDRAMAVTSTYFYTPSGLKIDKIGLSPQICTSESENCDGEDRFSKEEDIDRAVLYLKTGL